MLFQVIPHTPSSANRQKWSPARQAIQKGCHLEQHDIVAPAQLAQERTLVARAVGQEKPRALPAVTVERALDV